MDYEKKYNEALERAKEQLEEAKVFDYKEEQIAHVIRQTVYDIFPELKESEDERIINGLIRVISKKSDSVLSEGLNYTDVIAWLERQKFWCDNKFDDTKQEIINYFKCQSRDEPSRKDIHNKWISWLEKQGKQNPVDKVEPKFNFNVGQWIVATRKCVYLIAKIDGFNVTLVDTNGYEYMFDVSSLDDAYQWTIQDAKDGDVLCDYYEAFDNPLIFILKKFEHVNFGLVRPSDYSSYCFLTADNKQKFKEGTYHHERNIKPATKEQRDLLFQKMKEAGYEWNAEKKELKKIEQKQTEFPNGEDYGIDGLYHAISILEKTLGKVDGYQTDDGILEHKCAINAIKELSKQNPVWSEEDEKLMRVVVDYLIADNGLSLKHINWLKSLKERYTWRPSDEQITVLHDVAAFVDYSVHPHQKDILVNLYLQLKKLMKE